jgi:hypothetical protein
LHFSVQSAIFQTAFHIRTITDFAKLPATDQELPELGIREDINDGCAVCGCAALLNT